MSYRQFKRIFSVLVVLLLMICGFALGTRVRWSAYASVPSYSDLTRSYPFYGPFVVAGFMVLGLLLGSIAGPIVAQRLVDIGNGLDRMSARDKVAVTVGIIVGLLVSIPFALLLVRIPLVGVPLTLVVVAALVYLGVRATMGMRDDLMSFGRPPVDRELPPALDRIKILDTNVVIDGRISDICKAGFLDGTVYIPGFVLDELQHVADSADDLKRARGRRGLQVLEGMKKEIPLVVRVLDRRLEPSATPPEVDARLVALAKVLNASIVTNDFNLNKVAGLQGVPVLNVNELANALKPVVLPGEEMRVLVIREGKEANQGVAYLDDGTMIVVEDGKRFINTQIRVVVTSVLQTVAGKMIFARAREGAEADEPTDGGRSRASGGARGKVR